MPQNSSDSPLERRLTHSLQRSNQITRDFNIIVSYRYASGNIPLLFKIADESCAASATKMDIVKLSHNVAQDTVRTVTKMVCCAGHFFTIESSVIFIHVKQTLYSAFFLSTQFGCGGEGRGGAESTSCSCTARTLCTQLHIFASRAAPIFFQSRVSRQQF